MSSCYPAVAERDAVGDRAWMVSADQRVTRNARMEAVVVSAPVELYCERCGSPLVLAAEVPATYCAGCRMYLCVSCRGLDDTRCLLCMTRTSARRPLSGITGARRAVRDVHDALTDLARLRTAESVNPEPDRVSDAASREWDVVHVRVDAAARAAELALEAGRRRHPFEAGRLEAELAFTRRQIEAMMPAPAATLPAFRSAVPESAVAPDPEDNAVRRPRRLRPIVIAAAAVTVILIIAIAALALPPDTATDDAARITTHWT